MAEMADLLHRATAGEHAAWEALMPVVYERLRTLARRALAHEGEPRTLDTTALVHELYLTLCGNAALPALERSRFYAYAASAMRHILVDAARRRLAEKRGAGTEHVDLDGLTLAVDADAHDVLAIDQALERLSATQPALARVVELRFFAGMSVEDTAIALDRDPRSIVRDWQKARLFLHRALAAD